MFNSKILTVMCVHVKIFCISVENSNPILEYHLLFIVQEQNNGSKECWKLGIRNAKVRTIFKLSSTDTNVFTIPNDILTFFGWASPGSFFSIEFNSNKSVGYLELSKDCRYTQGNINFNNSCIVSVGVTQKLILPGEHFIHKPTRRLLDKTLRLYFLKMEGRLRELKVNYKSHYDISDTFLEYIRYIAITKLEKLDISKNDFLGPGYKILFDMIHLRELYMSRCNLNSFTSGSFLGCPNLQILDLSSNRLKEIPKGIKSLKYLKVLNFSDQKVGRFQLQGESLPRNIEYLDLSHCNLESLKNYTFINLTSLRILILSNNIIKTLPPYIFNYMTFNAYIYLNGNNISINSGLILKSIYMLDLSSNQITIPNDLISVGNVTYLNLTKNYIPHWTGEFVFNSQLISIQHVNVSFNKISTINEHMQLSINSLKSIDIGGNLYNCSDCSLPKFQIWLTKNKIEIFNLNSTTNQLRCFESNDFNGTKILDAPYNKLCDVLSPYYPFIFGIPSGVLIVLITILIIFTRKYRFEIAYVKHLFNVKKRSEQQEKEGCTYDCFVSYSSYDREWVFDVLLAKLEDEDNYQLCLHERDFVIGTFIVNNVVNCIEKSRRTLLALTNNYIQSEWCQWELQMAQHRVFENSNDFLIMLELEKLDHDALPLHLRQLMVTRTYLEWPTDLEANKDNFWERLKQALGKPMQRNPQEPPEEGEPEEEEKFWAVALNGPMEEFLAAIGLNDTNL